MTTQLAARADGSRSRSSATASGERSTVALAERPIGSAGSAGAPQHATEPLDRRLEPRAGRVRARRAAAADARTAARAVSSPRCAARRRGTTSPGSQARMAEDEREVAGGGHARGAVGDGSRFRLRLVAHDPEAYAPLLRRRREPGALVRPARPLGARSSDPTPTSSGRWRDGYVARVNARVRRGGPSRSSTGDARGGRPRPGLPPLPRAARSCATARPTRALRISSTSPGSAPSGWSVLRRADRASVHEGLLANDSVGFHTERWRACVRRLVRGGAGRRRRRRRRTVAAKPIAVDADEFDALGREPGGAWRASASCGTDRARVVDRCASTAPIRRRTPSAASRAFGAPARAPTPSCTDASACSRCSTRRGRRFPSTWTTGAAIEAVAPPRSTPASARPAGEPLRLDVRDDFPRSVAAYKQFDVLLVNPVKDGLNLVAKEAPLVNERDGALVLSREAGRVRGAGRVGDRRRPARRRGAGRCAASGARAAPRGAERPALEAIRAGCASTTSTRGPSVQLEALDRRAPCDAEPVATRPACSGGLRHASAERLSQ